MRISAVIDKVNAELAEILAAHSSPRGHNQRLYRALGYCLELCQLCSLFPEERKALDDLIEESKPKNKRSYIERGSDIYIRVARFMFREEEHYANTSRYAHTLREAARRQISPEELPEFLATQGGVNVLYLSRPLDSTVVKTKCLRLAEQITVPKDREFTLRLIRQPDNSFAVVALDVGEDSAHLPAVPTAEP